MNDDEYYDSGPFCRHWSDPADCDLLCAHCGHKCSDHEFEAPGHCELCDDACPGWEDPE